MLLFDSVHPKAALIFPDSQVLSFQDLRARIEERKQALGQTSEILPIFAEATPEFLVTFLAGLEGGQPLALMNPHWTDLEKLDRQQRLIPAAHPDLALVLFTSGSSGSPKAVQLSLANIQANTKAVIQSLDFAQAPEQTLFLPLHYSYGILGQVLPALQLGITTRLISQFPKLIPELSQKAPIGMWSGVPSHWETILRALTAQADTSQVTHVISAGAPFSVNLRKKLKDRFPMATIYNNYGLTECSPRVLSYSSRHPDFLENYVGFPVGDFEVKVSDGGELWLSGSQVMLGYLGDPDGTAARIQNGWLRTGDQAQVRDDRLVSIAGRLDDLINVGGERISLIEIENELKSLASVRDAALSTREHPLLGTSLVAFVVPESHQTWDNQKTIKELSQKLSSTKVPREYRVMDQLPRLGNGKIDRARLLEILKST